MLILMERPSKMFSMGTKNQRAPSRYARLPKGLPYPHYPMVQMRAELFIGLPK